MCLRVCACMLAHACVCVCSWARTPVLEVDVRCLLQSCYNLLVDTKSLSESGACHFCNSSPGLVSQAWTSTPIIMCEGRRQELGFSGLYGKHFAHWPSLLPQLIHFFSNKLTLDSGVSLPWLWHTMGVFLTCMCGVCMCVCAYVETRRH